MNHIEPEITLRDLDPGERDPSYWQRFHQGVMGAVAEELAARRRAALTLGDVVLSWGRLVVPVAVVAAAVAALLVLRSTSDDELLPVAGLEELLSTPGDGEAPLPEFLHTDEVVDRDIVLFTVEAQSDILSGP